MTFHALDETTGTRIDVLQAERVSVMIPDAILAKEPLDTPDRAPRFMVRTLRCPWLVTRAARGDYPAASLDSTCNFR